MATSNSQTLHAPVVLERSYTPYHPVYRMPDHVTCDSQNLETIMRSIHSCFVRPNIDHHKHFPTSNQVSNQLSLRNSGPQALFWDTLKQAIYLYKIPTSERAIPVFDKAGMLASNAFVESPLTFVLELFSTFSPVNTAVCPDLRLALLRVFVHHAEQRFGSTHSVTVLCSETQKDRSAVEISERGLSLMIDLLTATRGTSDPLTLKAQLARIRLLRRGKDYDRAGAMARTLASSSIALFGIQSVAARLASRELEHILMDQNEWYQALEVCLSIVGQRSCAGEMPEPASLDGYVVYTMEDIAKIYDHLGQPGACVEWLCRAARRAGVVWGPSVATTHVVDKLVAALDEAGKYDDAMFWRGVLVSGGDGVA